MAVKFSTRSGLLSGAPRVVNVGLRSFAADLAARGIAVAHVDWRPPRGKDAAGRARAGGLIARLGRHQARIAKTHAGGPPRLPAPEPGLGGGRPAGGGGPQPERG